MSCCTVAWKLTWKLVRLARQYTGIKIRHVLAHGLDITFSTLANEGEVGITVSVAEFEGGAVSRDARLHPAVWVGLPHVPVEVRTARPITPLVSWGIGKGIGQLSKADAPWNTHFMYFNGLLVVVTWQQIGGLAIPPNYCSLKELVSLQFVAKWPVATPLFCCCWIHIDFLTWASAFLQSNPHTVESTQVIQASQSVYNQEIMKV